MRVLRMIFRPELLVAKIVGVRSSGVRVVFECRQSGALNDVPLLRAGRGDVHRHFQRLVLLSLGQGAVAVCLGKFDAPSESGQRRGAACLEHAGRILADAFIFFDGWHSLDPIRTNVREPFGAGNAIGKRDRHDTVVLASLNQHRQLNTRSALIRFHARQIAIGQIKIGRRLG